MKLQNSDFNPKINRVSGTLRTIRNQFDCTRVLNSVDIVMKWATSWQNLFMSYANNKDADQYDQHFWYSLPRLFNTSSFYIWNFKTLASRCSWADRFESYLVANLENMFSCDEAQIWWAFTVRNLSIGNLWGPSLSLCVVRRNHK